MFEKIKRSRKPFEGKKKAPWNEEICEKKKKFPPQRKASASYNGCGIIRKSTNEIMV